MEGQEGEGRVVLTRGRFLLAAGTLAASALVLRGLSPAGLGDGVPAAGAALPRHAENLLIEREGAGWRLTPLPAEPDGPIFRLNDAAVRVWRAADGRHTTADMATELSRAYGISVQRARADTVACLESLARLGLVSS